MGVRPTNLENLKLVPLTGPLDPRQQLVQALQPETRCPRAASGGLVAEQRLARSLLRQRPRQDQGARVAV